MHFDDQMFWARPASLWVDIRNRWESSPNWCIFPHPVDGYAIALACGRRMLDMYLATSKQTLFDRMGGEEGIRKLVDEFYERVLADPKLGPFFEHTPMERLRTMQYEFFAAALDGPSAYKGKQLSYVHYGKGIGREQFGRFIDRLFDTLQSYNLDKDTTHAIIGRLNLYADEITGGTADAE